MLSSLLPAHWTEDMDLDISGSFEDMLLFAIRSGSVSTTRKVINSKLKGHNRQDPKVLQCRYLDI